MYREAVLSVINLKTVRGDGKESVFVDPKGCLLLGFRADVTELVLTLPKLGRFRLGIRKDVPVRGTRGPGWVEKASSRGVYFRLSITDSTRFLPSISLFTIPIRLACLLTVLTSRSLSRTRFFPSTFYTLSLQSRPDPLTRCRP